MRGRLFSPLTALHVSSQSRTAAHVVAFLPTVVSYLQSDRWRSVAHVRSMVPDGALLGLRHDEIGQAMLLNLLLRNYLEYDSHHPELAHCTEQSPPMCSACPSSRFRNNRQCCVQAAIAHAYSIFASLELVDVGVVDARCVYGSQRV